MNKLFDDKVHPENYADIKSSNPVITKILAILKTQVPFLVTHYFIRLGD